MTNILCAYFAEFYHRNDDSSTKLSILIQTLEFLGLDDALKICMDGRPQLLQDLGRHDNKICTLSAPDGLPLKPSEGQATSPLLTTLNEQSLKHVRDLNRDSKQNSYCSFWVVGVTCFLMALLLLLFSIFRDQILVQGESGKTFTEPKINHEYYACSDDQYNQTYRPIVAEESVDNDPLKVFTNTSEKSPSILLAEDLKSLQILGNISSKHLIDILSRNRCLRNLSFENAAVRFENPIEIQNSHFPKSNCMNTLPILESLHFNKRMPSRDAWLAFEDCKMQYLKDISITNMVFNDEVLRILDMLQTRSPNLRFLKLHGFFENFSSFNPISVNLPTVKEVRYEITKFNDTSSSCETNLVLGNNFCQVFSSLEAFTSKNFLLFEDWFQIARCKTLTKLEIKVKYVSNILHTLNLAARFPNLNSAKIYLDFMFGCPDLVAFKHLEVDLGQLNLTAKFSVTYCSNCPMIRKNVFCLRNG